MSIHSSRSRGHSSHSGMSRSHSSMSHRSSFSHSHSSLSHRSSISHRSHSSISCHKSRMAGGIGHSSGIKSHRSTFKHHGISDAHAFAVGKATGVNINASARGAHGAALHRMRKARASSFKNGIKFTGKNGFKSLNGFNRKSRFNSSSRFGKNTGFGGSSTRRKVRLSHEKNKHYSYTNRINFDEFDKIRGVFNENYNNFNKYFGIIFIVVFFIVTSFIIYSIFASHYSRIGMFR